MVSEYLRLGGGETAPLEEAGPLQAPERGCHLGKPGHQNSAGHSGATSARYAEHTKITDPTRGSAVELRTAAHRNRDLPLNLLPYAQFPSMIPDGIGGILSKPASW